MNVTTATNLEHHNFGYDFSDGCVEQVAHGFTVDADWKDILPHCGQLFQLMDDLQLSKVQRCQRSSLCTKTLKTCFKDSAYLPNCFPGCYVVVVIIQVAEIMSSRQPLQEFSSLNVHLRKEAASSWTQITKAQITCWRFLNFGNVRLKCVTTTWTVISNV